MTDTELAVLITEYRAGLEAEMVILRRLEETAARQREASSDRDMTSLNRAADERDTLMAGLVNIESQLRDVRQLLSQSREAAWRLPGYREAAELHHDAIGLVARILKTDAESLEVLAAAETARRERARAIEQGETTLAAYRRVMTVLPGATLVDRLG